MENRGEQQKTEQAEEMNLLPEERLLFQLRRLYRQYGYRPYRMSKFEEFELYAANRDFLDSSQIITFTDTDGMLMALKPDVTLSIHSSFSKYQSLGMFQSKDSSTNELTLLASGYPASSIK